MPQVVESEAPDARHFNHACIMLQQVPLIDGSSLSVRRGSIGSDKSDSHPMSGHTDSLKGTRTGIIPGSELYSLLMMRSWIQCSSHHSRGLTCTPSICMLKCTCTPPASPVWPAIPIFCPFLTISPSLTSISRKWP